MAIICSEAILISWSFNLSDKVTRNGRAAYHGKQVEFLFDGHASYHAVRFTSFIQHVSSVQDMTSISYL